MLLMSFYNTSSNNNYQTDLSQISSNPQIQQLALKHLKNSGSIYGIHNSVYGQSTSSNNNNSSSYYNNGSSSSSAGSNGTYMYHYYYGCQPGNKITTVIG